MTVPNEAESLAEAEQMAEENWNRSQYILDADHFVGADFKAKECVRDKGSRAVEEGGCCMRQYEMTLVAISEKRVKISAESAEAAGLLAEADQDKALPLFLTNAVTVLFSPPEPGKGCVCAAYDSLHVAGDGE